MKIKKQCDNYHINKNKYNTKKEYCIHCLSHEFNTIDLICFKKITDLLNYLYYCYSYLDTCLCYNDKKYYKNRKDFMSFYSKNYTKAKIKGILVTPRTICKMCLMKIMNSDNCIHYLIKRCTEKNPMAMNHNKISISKTEKSAIIKQEKIDYLTIESIQSSSMNNNNSHHSLNQQMNHGIINYHERFNKSISVENQILSRNAPEQHMNFSMSAKDQRCLNNFTPLLLPNQDNKSSFENITLNEEIIIDLQELFNLINTLITFLTINVYNYKINVNVNEKAIEFEVIIRNQIIKITDFMNRLLEMLNKYRNSIHPIEKLFEKWEDLHDKEKNNNEQLFDQLKESYIDETTKFGENYLKYQILFLKYSKNFQRAKNILFHDQKNIKRKLELFPFDFK